MTFSLDGMQLTGYGEYFVSCGDYGNGGSIRVHGTVAGNGSFTAQTDQSLADRGASFVVNGRVPSSAGVAWTGSYTLDTTNAGSCKVQEQKTLTAEPISSFNGTYTGTGTFVDGSTRTPVSVTLALRQGSTVQDSLGKAFTDAALLNGTTSVTGIACFSTGAITDPSDVGSLGIGSVWGDSIHPSFRMDDGSPLVLNADVIDVSGNTLEDVAFGVIGGKCATSTTRSLRVPKLTRIN